MKLLNKRDYQLIGPYVQEVLDVPKKKSEIITSLGPVFDLFNFNYRLKVQSRWDLNDFDRFTRVLNRLIKMGYIKRKGYKYYVGI